MKKKINFADYEVIDKLDDEERKIRDDLSTGQYKSDFNNDVKKTLCTNF